MLRALKGVGIVIRWWSPKPLFVLPVAQTETPFYEEWWFLLVMALSSLILILLVVFALVLHGQSKKYKNCSTGEIAAPFQSLPCHGCAFSI